MVSKQICLVVKQIVQSTRFRIFRQKLFFQLCRKDRIREKPEKLKKIGGSSGQTISVWDISSIHGHLIAVQAVKWPCWTTTNIQVTHAKNSLDMILCVACVVLILQSKLCLRASEQPNRNSQHIKISNHWHFQYLINSYKL